MFDSWIFFVVVFVVCQITFLQTFKYLTRETKNIGALTVAVQITSAVSIMVLAPFFRWTWPSGADWWMWLLLAVSFVLFAINDRLDATTRKNLDISVDTMLHQAYRILFFPMLILVWGNPFKWASLVGGIVIILMNMMLIFEKRKFQFNKYVCLKLLSVVFFAAALTAQLRAVEGFNLPFVVFLSFGVPALFLLSIKQATPKTLYIEAKRKEWPVLLVCGAAQALMTFSLYMAYELGERVQVNSITAVYVLLNVVFAYIFLKERTSLVKKSIAAVVIVASLVFIAVSPF